MPVERAKVQDAYEAFGEIEALALRPGCARCAPD